MQEYKIVKKNKKGEKIGREHFIDTKYLTISTFLEELDNLKVGEKIMVEKTKNK